MNADQVRQLSPAFTDLPRLAETWLVLYETLHDVLACAKSQDMGHPERLAFIKNLASSALASVEKD
ncbi:MAG: hypothetical protein HY910_10925 [Desulfarculus sp.]|nr:hypothetical protein [Desulfarculus sp.]